MPILASGSPRTPALRCRPARPGSRLRCQARHANQHEPPLRCTPRAPILTGIAQPAMPQTPVDDTPRPPPVHVHASRAARSMPATPCSDKPPTPFQLLRSSRANLARPAMPTYQRRTLTALSRQPQRCPRILAGPVVSCHASSCPLLLAFRSLASLARQAISICPLHPSDASATSPHIPRHTTPAGPSWRCLHDPLSALPAKTHRTRPHLASSATPHLRAAPCLTCQTPGFPAVTHHAGPACPCHARQASTCHACCPIRA